MLLKNFHALFKLDKLLFFYIQNPLGFLPYLFQLFRFFPQMYQVFVIGFVHHGVCLPHVYLSVAYFFVIFPDIFFCFIHCLLGFLHYLQLFFFFSDSEVQNFLQPVTKRHVRLHSLAIIMKVSGKS